MILNQSPTKFQHPRHNILIPVPTLGWGVDNMAYYKYNICIEVFSLHVEILQLNAYDRIYDFFI